MCFKWKKDKISFFTVMLAAVVFFQAVFQFFLVYAADDYQYIFDSSGNPIITFKMDADTGTIYMYGKHSRSTTTINYRTFGYNFTIKDSNENPRSLGSGNYFYVERQETDEDDKFPNPFRPTEDYTVSTYKLDGNTIVNGVITLMKNQTTSSGAKKYKNNAEINAALAKGVTVYMSNAFMVIQRPYVGADEYVTKGKLCHSYADIIQEVRNVFGVDWTTATQEVLHSYYDNPITIKLNPFTYDVVYITQEDFESGSTDKILEIAEEKLETHCGSRSEFELSDPKNIVINGGSYEYAGASYYQYEGSKKFLDTTYQDGTISVEHQERKNATLYVLVKPKGDIDVSIKYVDTEGNVLEDNINGGKLTIGETYTYDTKDPFSTSNKVVYTYKGQYSYVYQLKSTGKSTEVSKKGNPASFKITDIKDKTKVILTFVYEKANNPPTSTEEGINYMDAQAEGAIKADNKGNELFDVTEGIPTTGMLYGLVQGSEYLIKATFKKIDGKALVPIKVTKTYLLKWNETVDAADGDEGVPAPLPPVPMEESVTVDEEIFIDCKFSYTEIGNISYYKIKKAELKNDALPGGLLELYPNGYNVPILNYQHYQSSDDIFSNQHVKLPAQLASGIDLGTQTITGTNKKPDIPKEDFKSIAASKVDKLQVRNDYLEFGSQVVLDAQYKDEAAPQLNKSAIAKPKVIQDNVLFKSNNEIAYDKKNGKYPSTGTLIYELVASFESNESKELSFPVNINAVIVHTPTVCDAKVETNIRDNQMINPDKTVASLVLDRPFRVTLPTTGEHRDIKGYGYRDYDKYIAARQVKFPFDVYRGNSNGGIFVPKNTWTSVGEDTQFYLPTWVTEGKYTIQFRSIAINAADYSAEEVLANLDLKNYVATDTSTVEISGRIYGLNLYDITDYPLWEEVFRASASSTKLSGFKYTVGDKNQNGVPNGNDLKYTVPLINGSHPKYRNIGVLKTGYKFRFNLTTVGTMYGEKDYIRIKPRFFYIKNGNRTEVDIYYTETINGVSQVLVKMGSTMDLENKKSILTGNPFLGINEQALKQTAYYSGYNLKDWKAQNRKVYTFTNIMIPGSLRTFVGYQSAVPTGVTEKMIAQSVQKWYGEYYLPAEIHVVEKGYDVRNYAIDHGYIDYNEKFWLTGGYIVINFDIETIKNGESHLSYTNATNAPNGYCNMWQREGYQNEKIDYKNNAFKFKYGDFVLYYTNKSVNDDYKSAGTH